MADERVVIEIELDDGTIKKGFVNLEGQAKISGKKAGRSLDKGIGNSIKKSLSGIRGQILGVAAAFATAFAGRRILQAAQQQEDAIAAVNTALKLSGEFSQEASRGIQDFASALQQTTGVGDETTLELFSLAKAFGFSAEQAKVATEAAIELSEAAGIALEEALRRVGRTISGSIEDVSKFAPEIRNLTKEQLAAGDAATVLLKALGGTAAGRLDTFSGSIKLLVANFGDLLEGLGEFVTKNKAIVGAINLISLGFFKASSNVKSFTDTQKELNNFSNATINVGVSITKFIIAPLELLGGVADLAIKTLVSGFVTLQGGFAFLAESVVRALALVTTGSTELTSQGEAFFNQFRQFTTEASTDAINSLSSIGEAEFSTGLLEQLESIRLKALETNAAINQSNKESIEENKFGLGELVNASDEILAEIQAKLKKGQAITIDLTKALTTALKSIVSQGGAAIGGALARGENAFAAFGKTVLGIIGDLLIQLGSALISIGIGIDALRASLTILSGAGAIAAGFALTILGGFLKGLSGGAGSLGAVPAGTGGGTETTAVPEGVEEEPDGVGEQAAVTVNIQGDVLDSDETGLRIVELINENFDAEGGVLATT